jgi:hypothetical protein
VILRICQVYIALQHNFGRKVRNFVKVGRRDWRGGGWLMCRRVSLRQGDRPRRTWTDVRVPPGGVELLRERLIWFQGSAPALHKRARDTGGEIRSPPGAAIVCADSG